MKWEDLSARDQIKYLSQAEQLVSRGYVDNSIPVEEIAKKIFESSQKPE